MTEPTDATGELTATQPTFEQAMVALGTDYEQMVSQISDVITVLDESGILQYASPSLRRILGHEPAHWIGRNVLDLVHPDDLETAVVRLAASFETDATARSAQVAALRLRHADGGWRHMEALGHSVYNRDGRAFGIVTARDVTAWIEVEHKRLADEARARLEAERSARVLQDTNAELLASRLAAEDANRAKSDFLSRMSHELRTPLNSIIGFGQLLDMGAIEGQEAAEAVSLIMRSGRHLLGLIDEILDISRIEARELSLSMEAVVVQDAVDHAVDVIRPQAQARGITVAAPGAADLAVDADPQRLTQVLLNLLSNAVKYNRLGGSITIEATRVAGAEVAVSVSDTGEGIAPELLDRLFHPFDRLGAEITSIEGTGIGLSLSKGLTEQMGGRLEASSEVGRGSRFTVTLADAGPVPRPGDRRHGSTAGTGHEVGVGHDDEGGDGRAVVVAYIEDNEVNVRLVERTVALRPQVRLEVAPDGATGIDLVETCRPDLVLLDLHLPDMSGRDVLAHLHAGAGTREIPVVVLTADAGSGLAAQLADEGAAGYLTKPLDLRRLLQLLDDTTAT